MRVFVYSFWIFSKDRWPSNPATFTSGFNWIPEISRQPIIFRNCSISSFDRHMKLNTSAKFHDFNQKSYNPCMSSTAPHYFQFSVIRFDAPTLLSFSVCTHAHANCPPVDRAYSGEVLDKMRSKENKTVAWLHGSGGREGSGEREVTGSNPGLTNTRGL